MVVEKRSPRLSALLLAALFFSAARPRPKVEHYVFHQFKGSNIAVSKVWVFTDGDKVLQNFLLLEHVRLKKWIRTVASQYTCGDILTPRVFVQFEMVLGAHIQNQYQKLEKRKLKKRPDILVEIYMPDDHFFCFPTP